MDLEIKFAELLCPLWQTLPKVMGAEATLSLQTFLIWLADQRMKFKVIFTSRSVLGTSKSMNLKNFIG